MNHDEVKRRLLFDPAVQEAYENPPLPLLVARVVVERRRALGLTQGQLAERLGTTQNQVWRIESGDANVTMKTLERLHDVLGIRFSVEVPCASTSTADQELSLVQS